ncbi:MAG: hypothetical protein SFV51_15725 [Bryobacteraceae bacterium]|nr:hypothetical protein [Bryobacteraceae bacterium]
MNNNAFQELWARGASAPKVTHVPVQKRSLDLSLEEIVERLEEWVAQAMRRGAVSEAHFNEMKLHAGALKGVLRRMDPARTLVANERQRRDISRYEET